MTVIVPLKTMLVSSAGIRGNEVERTDEPIDVRRIAASIPRTSPRAPSVRTTDERAANEFL